MAKKNTTKEYIKIPNDSKCKVQMRQAEQEDGTYSLQAILVDAKTLERIPGANYRYLTAYSTGELATKKNILFRRVTSQLDTKPRGKATKDKKEKEGEEENNPYREAFDQIHREMIHFPGWGKETRKKALLWFSRHFLPLLENSFSGEEVTVIGGPALQDWKRDQREMTTKHGNADGDGSVAKTMATHYQQCAKIYQVLREIDRWDRTAKPGRALFIRCV